MTLKKNIPRKNGSEMYLDATFVQVQRPQPKIGILEKAQETHLHRTNEFQQRQTNT